MRILILGAGKMGSFFTDILSFQHETAVFDVNPHQLRFVYNTYRFTTLEEIKEFEPELVINAATVKYTLDAFRKYERRYERNRKRVGYCFVVLIESIFKDVQPQCLIEVFEEYFSQVVAFTDNDGIFAA